MPCKEAVEAAEAVAKFACDGTDGFLTAAEKSEIATLINAAMAPAIEAGFKEGLQSAALLLPTKKATDHVRRTWRNFWLHSAARKAMGIGENDE